jgi:hypothetical protein
MLKFAIITAIILPVLPNQSFWEAPFDVLNPYKIWLMVVLISGIGFLGYILVKLVGSRHGIGLTGFLGGLVSSTAVTLTFAQRSQKESQHHVEYRCQRGFRVVQRLICLAPRFLARLYPDFGHRCRISVAVVSSLPCRFLKIPAITPKIALS